MSYGGLEKQPAGCLRIEFLRLFTFQGGSFYVQPYICETKHAEVNDSLFKIHMGDKSPKAVQKKSGQKQSKTASSNQKKQQAIASKQASGKGR